MANVLEKKIGKNVKPEEISVPPSLNYFQCKFTLPNRNNEPVTYDGRVKDFRNKNLLKLEFWAPLNSEERPLIENHINYYINPNSHDGAEDKQLKFDCNLGLNVKEKVSKKTFHLNHELIEKLDLGKKLFNGLSNSEVYITANQLEVLAVEIYKAANAREKYEMTKENFVKEILKVLNSRLYFEEVKFTDDLKLSAYPKSEKADELIVQQLGLINKSLRNLFSKIDGEIKVNESEIQVAKGSSVLYRFYQKFNVWSTIEKFNKTINRSCLDVLNQVSENYIEWKSIKDTIEPRFLIVANLKKALFFEPIAFEKIKKTEYETTCSNVQNVVLKTDDFFENLRIANCKKKEEESKQDTSCETTSDDSYENLFKQLNLIREKLNAKFENDLEFVKSELEQRKLADLIKNLKEIQDEISEHVTTKYKDVFLKRLNGHTDKVFALAHLPNGLLVSGSEDSTIKLWNLTSGLNIRTLQEESTVPCFTFLKNKSLIVSGSQDNGALKIWDTNTFTLSSKFKPISRHNVVECITLVDGRLLSSGKSNNSIVVWDTVSKQSSEVLAQHNADVLSLRGLPNGDMASGDVKGSLFIWNTTMFTIKERNKNAHHDPIHSIVSLSNGDLASAAREIKVWSLKNNKMAMLREFGNGEESIFRLLILPNDCLVSAHETNVIKIWNATSGEHKITFKYHTKDVYSLAILDNGDLASGSYDSSIVILSKDVLNYYCIV